MKKKVNGLRNTFVRQVATKFRVEAVTSKLSTYERLWSRTMQEIEAGTYKRDLFKLKLRSKEKEPEKPADKVVEKKVEAAKAPGPTAPPAGPPGSPGGGAISDQKMKAIFDAYVMAKKRCNEDVSKLTLDSLAMTLRGQVPTLLKQHNAKSVEFKIVIKDGKAILRALPKDT